MKRVSPAVILAALITAPASLAAQQAADDAPPQPTLRLSFYKCDLSQVEAIQQELETRVIPMWEELVSEGMVESTGYFFHSWAGEWNVGLYTIAADIPAVIAASDEFNSRMEERHPDAESAFAQACPEHRDGFYTLGPRTGMDDASGGGG
ncbi:MAG: hypothetical protein ACRELC_08065 [Gemmatimonadota bacterium]